MRAVVVSAISAVYLFGANGDPQSIVNEVAKLRQKYEECRQEQTSLSASDAGAKIKGYQKRIANLENQIKERDRELLAIKKRNTEIERELSQKRGVIQSLEKSLTFKDQKYREFAAQNERLANESNTLKVGKIERENLKRALIKAKTDLEQLEKSMGKTDKEAAALRISLANAKEELEKLRNRPVSVQSGTKTASSIVNTTDQSAKIKALQSELSKANTLIAQMQKAPAHISVQEKIVTKVVEPTEKIAVLQRELSAAQATIANLKKGTKTLVQEKIVEKVIYKDRPVVQEKVITKVVEPTAKIVALQRELSAAQATIAHLKSGSSEKTALKERVVYKDRPVEKIVEKVVYKERPASQEKVAVKSVNSTEKLNRALQKKLAQNEAESVKLKANSQKLAPQTKASAPQALKAPVPASAAPTPKKGGSSSAYRMASNAPIYNGPGGSVIDTWEARRSFTAGNPSGGWVHITGYFVNRVWQPTGEGENLWVKESDVIRR